MHHLWLHLTTVLIWLGFRKVVSYKIHTDKKTLAKRSHLIIHWFVVIGLVVLIVVVVVVLGVVAQLHCLVLPRQVPWLQPLLRPQGAGVVRWGRHLRHHRMALVLTWQICSEMNNIKRILLTNFHSLFCLKRRLSSGKRWTIIYERYHCYYASVEEHQMKNVPWKAWLFKYFNILNMAWNIPKIGTDFYATCSCSPIYIFLCPVLVTLSRLGQISYHFDDSRT